MQQIFIGKLFEHEGDQAVQLPPEIQFAGDTLYAWRDEATGNVILSSNPIVQVPHEHWRKIFAEMDALRKPGESYQEYMDERPMNEIIPDESSPDV